MNAPLPAPAPSARPTGLKVWIQAARPATLTLSAAPVILGAAFAWIDGVFDGIAVFFALWVAAFIQIGTNIANDYFDFKKGADTADRLGPARVTQQGWAAPEVVLRAAILCFALAFLGGLVLVYKAGWILLLVGILSILAGAWYTGGPAPLAYTGLSDIFVVIFFGPVAVLGTYYAQSRMLSLPVGIASIALGLIATAVLVVNNLRDRHTDVLANKRTMVVRLGRRFGEAEHAFCMLAPFAIVTAGVLIGWFRWGALATLALVPVALYEIRAVRQKDGADLNAHLGGAARAAVLFAIVFSLGILLT